MSTFMTSAVRGCAAALMVATFAPGTASAQLIGQDPAPPDVRRPYRGIFNVPPDSNKSHSLVFSGSLFAAYDDNIFEGLTDGRARDWRYQRSGRYAGASAGLNYAFSRSGERVSFGAQTGGQVNYYDRGDDSHTSAYYNGAVSMDARLTRSTTLSASQTAGFSPGYSFTFPALGGVDEALVDVDLPMDPDLELFRLEAVHLNSRVALTQRLSRGTSLTGGWNYRHVNFRGEELTGSRFRDYGSHSGFARLSYQRGLTQYSSLNLGYGIRVSDRNDRSGRPRVLHDIQAGIRYGRPLSISRRTSFSFSTGSAIAVREDLSNPDAGTTTTARLTGNASLVHELGRTWTARATYRRGLTFREGFDNEFFFTDSLGVDVGGLVTRRLSASAAGAWSFARLDRPGRNRQTAFSGTAQATYALARYLGLFARYVYYDYEFGEDVPLDPRLPRALERHAVRVGLTTSIPLIR
ncbi:MAG: hypothetical protein H0X67_00345 [Acidobacteria bacterium]|nr:hypothetical protein [Acidobacteriota bacterium]